MPLPPPPSDSESGPQARHDPAGDARVRAHMIGADKPPTDASGVLARLRRWLAMRLARLRR